MCHLSVWVHPRPCSQHMAALHCTSTVSGGWGPCSGSQHGVSIKHRQRGENEGRGVSNKSESTPWRIEQPTAEHVTNCPPP